MNPKRPIGQNSIGTFCKLLARRAGIIDWFICRNHSWRAYGITQHAKNPHVSFAEGINPSRHKHSNTYVGYIGNGDDSENRRVEAIRDQNAKPRKQY